MELLFTFFLKTTAEIAKDNTCSTYSITCYKNTASQIWHLIKKPLDIYDNQTTHGIKLHGSVG